MKRYFLSYCFFAFIHLAAFAQTTPESRLAEARSLASANKHEQARLVLYELLEEYPAYYDASVLEARTYAWQQNYDSARLILQHVLTHAPAHSDALEAITDVELWAGNIAEAILYAQLGIDVLPEQDVFYLKKAKAYLLAEEWLEADNTLLRLLQKIPNHTEAKEFRNSIKAHTYRYATELTYIYSLFASPTPHWHWVNLQQTARYKKHLFNVSVNWAQRFNISALQYEAEAYPVLSKSIYAYTGIAYSEGIIFPRIRAGAEIFKSIGKRQEVSLGFRYFDFIESKSTILTGSFSQAYKTYLFTIRPFVNFAESAAAPAASITAKRFLKDNRFNFVALTYSYGFVPDNPAKYAVITQGGLRAAEAYPMQSSGLRLDLQHDLYKGLKIKGLASYENEEYLPASFRSRISIGAGLLYIY